jgi:hypothetical protein
VPPPRLQPPEFERSSTSSSAFPILHPQDYKIMMKVIKLIDLEDLRRRAQEEIALRPLTTEDIKGLLIKSSFDAYAFTMEQ